MTHHDELACLVGGLLEGLRAAAATYRTDPKLGACHAVAAACNFVADLKNVAPYGLGDEDVADLAAPLLRLAQALADQTEGSHDPFLEPPRNRKKAVPINTQMARADAAAAMCVLMETGMGEAEAAREVARHLRGSAVLQTKGDAAGAIVNWRKRVLGRGEARAIHDLPPAPDWEQQAAGVCNLALRQARARIEAGHPAGAIRSETLEALRRAHPPPARRRS